MSTCGMKIEVNQLAMTNYIIDINYNARAADVAQLSEYLPHRHVGLGLIPHRCCITQAW